MTRISVLGDRPFYITRPYTVYPTDGYESIAAQGSVWFVAFPNQMNQRNQMTNIPPRAEKNVRPDVVLTIVSAASG
jgi:hypothetical protein